MKIVRWLWLKSISVERRLFLLSEIADLKRKGHRLPSDYLGKILRSPSDVEDYINLSRLVRPGEKVFLIDAGANTGYWLADFLHWFPGSKAIAFEPAASSFAALSARFEHDSGIEPVKAALSNAEGSAELRITDDSTLNSLEAYNPEFAAYRHDTPQSFETVPLVRLDQAVKDMPADHCVILKLDVQGHEIEVMEGATGLLKKIDVALCELSFVSEYVGKDPSFAKVTAIMEQAGLYPVVFQEYGKPISNHRLECDVVFARKDRFPGLFLANVQLPGSAPNADIR